MSADAPIGPDDLMGLAFDHTPTMLEIAQLKERIKAGFGADAKVEITLRHERVHFEISVPIRARESSDSAYQPGLTAVIIPVTASAP